MATFKKIDPVNMAETANLVQVFNISPDSTEKKIVDFFQYCGDIIEYEIVEVENGFEALLLFDKASSVDTAVLLNNSRIDDRNIIVKKYDDAVKEAAEFAEAAAADAVPAAAPATGSKLANFIADTMIKAETLSKSVDTKLGVTEKFNLLVEESKRLGKSVDEKYGISEKTAKATTAINTKIDEFKNNEKVTAARSAGQTRVAAAKTAAQPTLENIKHSTTVKKLQDVYAQVKEKLNEVTQETIEIKKSKTVKANPDAAVAEAAPEGAALAAEAKASGTATPEAAEAPEAPAAADAAAPAAATTQN